jgi:hypothetical protein
MKVSRNQYFRIFQFLGIKFSKFQGFKASGL